MRFRYLLLLYFLSHSALSTPVVSITQPRVSQFPITQDVLLVEGTAYNIPDNGLDLVVVIDDSGSIAGSPSIARDNSIKQLFCSITQLAGSEDIRTGVVVFSDFAEVLIPLIPIKDVVIEGRDGFLDECQQPVYSSTFVARASCAPSIDNCISALYENGGTSTDAAILQATQVFLDSGTDTRERRVLLFTDGMPNYTPSAVRASEQAALQNIQIDVVGLGFSGQLDENGQPATSESQSNYQIATSSAGGHLYSADQSNLANTFIQIALDIKDVMVTQNGVPVPTEASKGLFFANVNLNVGGNFLQARAFDNNGVISTPITGHILRGTNTELLDHFANSIPGISLSADNVLSYTSPEGITETAFIGEITPQPNPVIFAGSLRAQPTTDINNDGINDTIVQYPNGDESIMYYFGTQGNQPSETALVNYFQATGINFDLLDNNRLNMTFNGQDLQLQLDSNVTAGAPPARAELVFSEVDDLNGDGKRDYKIIYPNGVQQNVYNLTP